jgi:integrase
MGMLAGAVARRRSLHGSGGLTRKKGRYTVAGTGEVRSYTYWQASREFSTVGTNGAPRRQRVTGSGASPAEAWRRCNANYDAWLLGDAGRKKPAPSPRVTVRDLFAEWQANNLAGAVSAVMASKYQGYFKNHILPHIGDVQLGRLSEADLNGLFHRTLADKVNPKNGKPLLSESSRRNVFMALSGCLHFAVRSGYIAHNPLRYTSPPRKGMPHDDIEVALTALEPLLAAIQAPGNADEARHLLAFLGLRRSERLGLRWSDISGLDTDSPVLHVRGQLARDPSSGRLIVKTRTKSGVSRAVALAEPFIGALRRHRDRQFAARVSGNWVEPAPEHVDLLFLQANGYPVDQNDDNDDWRLLLASTRLPYFRAHLTRHLTAVILARQPNVSIATVMSILGHNSRAMTLYYAHLDRAIQVNAIRSLGQSLTGMAHNLD